MGDQDPRAAQADGAPSASGLTTDLPPTVGAPMARRALSWWSFSYPRPIGVPERSRLVDVIRGVALLGILPVNISFWAIATEDFATPPLIWPDGQTLALDGLLEVLVLIFFSNKFIGLFTLLLGFGFGVLHERCLGTRGNYFLMAGTRLLVLAVLGTLHTLLLSRADILFYYALMGPVCVLMINAKVRTLLVVSTALLLLSAAALGVIGYLHMSIDHPALVRLPVEQYADLPWTTWIDPAHQTRELETYLFVEAPFEQAVIGRFLHWLNSLPVSLLVYVWFIPGMTLLGLALQKTGILIDPAAHRRTLATIGICGLTFGIPLTAAFVVLNETSGGSGVWFWVGHILHHLGAIGLSLAYLWLLSVAFLSGRLPIFCSLMANIGRTALSNYILQSVICSFVFFGVGWGLFGQLSVPQQWTVILATWAANIAFAWLWLKIAPVGPLEWFSRLITYGRFA